MSAQLPVPGGDDGTWGSILNSFLSVSLNSDGTLITSAIQQAGAVTSVNNVSPSGGNVTLTASTVGALPTSTPLAGLADTSAASGAANGQVLTYDSTGNSWVPATVSNTPINNATGSSPGIVQLSGDLGGGVSGTATSPEVTSTHLTSALPINQGGTGSTTQNFVDLSSGQTIGGSKTFSSTIAGNISGNAATVTTIPNLTGDVTSAGTATTVGKIKGISLPSSAPIADQVLTASNATTTIWSTPAAGVLLDTSASDIQADSTSGSASAGSTGKAADAGHQHKLVSHNHTTADLGGLVPLAGLSTGGTADSSTYLRGDGSWQTPVAGSTTLAGDTDVSLASLSNGQILTYDSTTSKWVNQAVPSVPDATSGAPGLIQLAGDVGGSATDPQIESLQGITLPGTTPLVNQVLTANSGTTTIWSTPAAGVLLDTSASDIQADSTSGSASAGSTGKAADAGHQHKLVSHNHTTADLGGQISMGGLNASGTASSSTYLRGDGTWNTPTTGSTTLAGDTDVSLASLSNGQVLTYDSTTSKWNNQALPSVPDATSGAPGLIQLAGDVGGSATDPQIESLKGITLPSGSPSTNQVLTASNATTMIWQTPAAGVTLDTTSTDILDDSTSGSAVAGSTGLAADAGHQHKLVSHNHTTANLGGQIPMGGLNASGTASSSTYLRGDGSWQTPVAGSTTLAGDTDVSLASLSNGQVLTYDSTTSKWNNQAVPSAPNATSGAPGLIQLAGDIGGSATDPKVESIQGIAISGTPSSGETLIATSGTAASWQAGAYGPPGLLYLSGGGAISATTITNAISDGYTGLYLDPRDTWDASGLVIYGIVDFIIESRMTGSIGYLGNITYGIGETTGYINTGSGVDGIQIYGNSGANNTQGIIFRNLVFKGSNSNAVVHFGGRQRSCIMQDCFIINTNSTTGAYGIIDDSGLTGSGANSFNSEDQYFDNLSVVGAYACIGLGIGDDGQHANDTIWNNVTTYSTGPYSIVADSAYNHQFNNYYDRSSPSVATVYNHGGRLIFNGGEDLNASTGSGVAHLLDASASYTTIINRMVSVGSIADTITVSNGIFTARGNQISGTVTVSGSGQVDFNDSSVQVADITISGSSGTLYLASQYQSGSLPNLSGWSGTTLYQTPSVVASQDATGATSATTVSWTPPADCMFRVSVMLKITTAGTSTVPVLSFKGIGSVAFSETLAMWEANSSATTPSYTCAATANFAGSYTSRCDTGTNVQVVITPTGSTYDYVVVIEQLTDA